MSAAPSAPTFRYPVALDLAGRACLVVGGGAVAARKTKGLLEATARVTVVSPLLVPALRTLADEGRVHWKPREYQAGDVAGAWLVLVTTDDRAVNAEVAAEARRCGVWVNCADDPAHCDFALPAVLRRGPLTVAVSTGGASPAMARLLREEIGRRLPADWGAVADLVAGVRRELRARGIALGGARWRAALGPRGDELRALIAAGREREAREWLRERLGA
jgi:precorrin-2 dehydrogenase/sirohydrochlorin ferrochelatase